MSALRGQAGGTASRPTDVTFVVRTERFAETLGFYADVLALELVEEWSDGGRGAVLRIGENAVVEVIELDAPGGYGGVALGLEVDDVDAWYHRLRARGARVNAPPVEAFGKRGFGATDPNGVPVNVYTTELRGDDEDGGSGTDLGR